MKRGLLVGLAAGAVIAVAVALAGAFDVGRLGGRDRGPVIATVRGHPIYLEEARARLRALTSFHSARAQDVEWGSLVLRSLADEVLLELAAADMAITVSEQDVERQLTRLRSRFSSEEGFERWLEAQGMDEGELRRRIRQQILTARIFERVTAGVTVPPERVRAHYERYRDEYPGPTGEPLPFYAVRSEIREELLRRAKERAYARWLEAERARAEVVVVMPDWFRRIS